jgi:hypothetical protein
MTEILELSQWEFRTIMINILNSLTNKTDSMPKQMDNVSTEKRIRRDNYKEMLEIKKH